MSGEQPPASPERRVTIADVARAAGVSQTAVSFALNGRPGIGDDTRQRILRVADELGWRPSARARALARSRAGAVGLVIARPVELLAGDPYFGRFLAGLELALSPADHALVLQVVTAGLEEELQAYRSMAATGRVDGFVLTDVRDEDPRFELLADLGLPVVVTSDPTMATPFPAYGPDELVGTCLAVRALLDRGHRRIAHVSGSLVYEHARRRREAWVRELEAAGVAERLHVEADFTAAGGERATEQLLAASPRPTAIVYGNDVMAMAGLTVLRRHGVMVPDEMSVIGHDDDPMAIHLTPALTTVRQDVVGLGREVAAHLLAVVTGAPVDTGPTDEPVLVLRDSVAPPPAGSQLDTGVASRHAQAL